MIHQNIQPAGWAPARGYANGVAARGTQIFVGGQIGHAGSDRSGPFEIGVVNDDRHTVSSKPNVHLDTVGIDRKSVTKRGQRIFRCKIACSAMGDDERPSRFGHF